MEMGNYSKENYLIELLTAHSRIQPVTRDCKKALLWLMKVSNNWSQPVYRWTFFLLPFKGKQLALVVAQAEAWKGHAVTFWQYEMHSHYVITEDRAVRDKAKWRKHQVNIRLCSTDWILDWSEARGTLWAFFSSAVFAKSLYLTRHAWNNL